MADLNSVISLLLQLESAGEKEAADKVSAAIERINKTQQIQADQQQKAVAAFNAGSDEVAAHYFQLGNASEASAQRQIQAALNVGKALQDEKNALDQLADKELAKSIEGIGKAFDSVVTSLANGQAPINAIKEGISKIGELASQVFGPDAQIVAQFVNGFIALGQAFVDITIHAAEAQRQLDLIAGSTGLKPETVAAVRTAAQAIGASYLQVVAAADKFSEAQIKAQQGSEKSVELFARLNLSLTDLSGNLKNNDDLFREAINKFAQLPAGAEKAALGYELFGLRSEKAILAIGANLDKLRQQAIDAGLVLDEKGAQSLRNFTEASIELGNFIDGLRNQIGAFVADTLTGLAKEATAAIKALKADPGVVTSFKEIGTVILTLVQVFGSLTIKIVEFAGFLVGIPGALANIVAQSAALRVVVGTLTLGLSELGLAFFKLGQGTEETNQRIQTQIEINKEFIKQQEEKKAAIEKVRLAQIEGTEENKKAQAEAKAAFEETKAQNAASVADFKATTAQKIEQQQLAFKLQLQGEKETNDNIKQLKKDALDFEIGILIQQRTAAENAAKVNKALLKDVDDTNKAISKAKIALAIEEGKELVEEAKETTKQILLQYDIEKQARIAALQKAIQAINELEQAGTLNHAQAEMMRAKLTEDSIQKQIDAENAKAKDIRLSQDQRNAAEKESAKLVSDLAKQKKQDELDYHKAVTKDLDEQLAQRKKLEEGYKEQVKSYIFELIQKDKDAGVSREDTIRRVAQAQLQANEAILASKENELELLKKDEPEALAKIQDYQNQIKQLKIDNGELEKIIKGDVDETSLSYNKQLQEIDKLVGKQKDLTQAVKDTKGAVQDLANQIADLAQKTPAIAAGSLDITKLSLDDLKKQIADVIDQLSNIGEASGTAAIAARQGLNDTLAALQAELIKREQDAQNQAYATAQDAAQKNADALKATEEKEAQDFINIQNMIVDARKKAAADSKAVADKFFKDVKTAQDDFNNQSEKDKEAFDKQIADEDKKANADELERIRQLNIEKRNLANAARDQALNDALKTITDRSKLEKAVKDASSPEEKKKAQDELDKFNKAAAERDRLTKQKADDIDKARRESKTKEEYDAKVKAINDQYQTDVDAIAQRQQLIDDGNQAELAQLEAAIAAKKAQRQKELDEELADIAETQKMQQDARDAARQAEIDAFTTQENDRKAAFQQKILDLQTQAIMEQTTIQNNLDAQIKQYQAAAKTIADTAGISQAAYDALFAAIKKGALDAAQALAALGAATPIPGGSQPGTSPTPSGTPGGPSQAPAPTGNEQPGIGGPPGDNSGPQFFIKKAPNSNVPTPSRGPGKKKETPPPPAPGGGGTENQNNISNQDSGKKEDVRSNNQSNTTATSAANRGDFIAGLLAIYDKYHNILSSSKDVAELASAEPNAAKAIDDISNSYASSTKKLSGDTASGIKDQTTIVVQSLDSKRKKYKNAAIDLADYIDALPDANAKKEEQDNTTATNNITPGDFNKTGGKGTKPENNDRSKGKARTQGQLAGSVSAGDLAKRNKSNAIESRGDTQIDEAAQRESDMLAALRGIATATNGLTANLNNNNNGKSLEMNSSFTIIAPGNTAQDIKAVVQQVLAEERQKLKQQAPGFLETS